LGEEKEKEKEKEKEMNNIVEHYLNKKSYVIKKYMADILKEKYPDNESIIERISSCLTTEKDAQAFGTLIGNVYEAAYKKAVSEYKDQLAKLGIEAVIKPEPN
jgi:hypothetical protein